MTDHSEQLPPKTTTSNEFDRVVKENISEITDPFMTRQLGLHPDKVRKLPTEMQRTLERRLDEVNLIEEDGEEQILHFEYQRNNDEAIVARMLEYRAFLYRKYRKPIIQAVLYYGEEPMTMENEYTDPQTTMHFELKDIRSITAQSLLGSAYPEEVIMAVLGNFRGKSPETIIKSIFEKLKKLTKTKIEFQKYSERLIIFAKSRKFDKTAEQIRAMFDVEYKPEDFYTFRIAKANVERSTSEKIAFSLLQTTNLSFEQIAQNTELPLETIQQLAKNIEGQNT